MAQRLDGKAVSAQVRARVAEEVKTLQAEGITPGLAVVIVGDDPASRVYVNNKKKASIPRNTPCPPKPHRRSFWLWWKS